MRRIVLAALLAAVALPAWAANDGTPQPYDGNIQLQNTAFELCKRVGGNASDVSIANICALKHVYGEDMALRAAISILNQCDIGPGRWPYKPVADCNVERVYIKQRWGY